jgi:hypothetical protein
MLLPHQLLGCIQPEIPRHIVMYLTYRQMLLVLVQLPRLLLLLLPLIMMLTCRLQQPRYTAAAAAVRLSNAAAASN